MLLGQGRQGHTIFQKGLYHGKVLHGLLAFRVRKAGEQQLRHAPIS
jgi:hypothetical protein